MPKVKKRHFLDYGILIPYLLLCIVGLIMVYSSTSYLLISQDANPASLVINQTVFWILSLAVITVMYKMKTNFLRNKNLIQVITMIVFVLLVVVRLIGEERNGSRGWLSIGPINLQPAEYLKILVIWYLANILSNRQETIQKNFWPSLKQSLFLVLGMIFLVVIQPDMGNATIITLLAMVMLLASGTNWFYSVLVGVGGFLMSFLTIEFMTHFGDKILPGRFHYIYERFASFKNPFAYELNEGHQLVNGYYAMFNGGLFGRGLGNSIEKKGFLSEAHTDFIFAIVIEELGLIVAIIILGLLLFMTIRIFLIGIRSKKPFNSLMCIGIGSLFLIQIFINLGGITGMIPLTGITFPFISQGGNSLLVLSAAVGFALNISAEEKRAKLESQYRQLNS